MKHTEASKAGQALGRRGGLARAKNLNEHRRKQIAQQAANTRWGLQRSDRDNMIARLSIRLQVDPDVERRLEVPLSVNLEQLHRIFQAAMGWGDYHLYAFFADRPWRGITYMPGEEPQEKRPVGATEITFGTMIHDRGIEEARPATDISLGEFLGTLKKKTFSYVYDFGDDWEHRVRVTGLGDRHADIRYPRLLSAIGHCPPEDVGGPWGYRDYLAIMSDPAHPKHAEIAEWSKETQAIDLPYDPNFADPLVIQQRLDALRHVAGLWLVKPPVRPRSYIVEKPDGKRRLTILEADFIMDLARELGREAYAEIGDEIQGRLFVRFQKKPYELRFITGGGMAAGPDRVFISCNIMTDSWHLGTMSVNIRRPLPDIVRDVHNKLLKEADRRALARYEQLIFAGQYPLT